MRERGTQSRRARAEEVGPVQRIPKGPRAPRDAGYWPAVAIIAVIVATAGWTTVAVMALNSQSAPAAAAATDEPIDSFDDSEAGSSDAPAPPTHEVPDLEALLPTQIAGVPMSIESWAGDTLLAEGGPLNDAMGAFMTSKGKAASDLSFALASDPEEATDNSVGVFRANGVPTKDLLAAMVAAWKEQYPELVVSTVTFDGTDVTKGAFGEDAIDSFWYEKDGLLFDVETTDQALAGTIVVSLRDGTPLPAGTLAPSGAPADSAAPEGSPAPSPS